eukprot:COSAG02_NODE_63664_length_262_cov_1.276074_1_plen_73_part_01
MLLHAARALHPDATKLPPSTGQETAGCAKQFGSAACDDAKQCTSPISATLLAVGSDVMYPAACQYDGPGIAMQ